MHRVNDIDREPAAVDAFEQAHASAEEDRRQIDADLGPRFGPAMKPSSDSPTLTNTLLIVSCSWRSSGLRLDLGAKPLFLRPQLRRELFAEVFRLEHRSNFDFGPATKRRALEPFDRLVHRLHL